VQTRDLAEEVPVGRYLTERHPVPHLFEIGPDQFALTRDTPGATEAAEPGAPDAVTALASVVRARGGRDTDVRLLVDEGERHLELAADLADNLHCDVYLTRRGAGVRYVHERSAATGDTWDAVAIDLASGTPTDWLVVRPPGLPTTAATWFSSVQGRLRPGRGLVTVGLPDGVAFATRATYRDTAYLASRLLPSGQALTTVAVNADTGLFEIARFEGSAGGSGSEVIPQRRRFGHGGREGAKQGDGQQSQPARLHGTEFAGLMGGCLPVIHPDVQMALTWPKDADACTTLHAELLALADGLDRTVWVPEPQGSAFVVPGFGEFAAVDEVGTASRWRAYPPSSGRNRTTLFGTDLDGRLAPLGEVGGARFAGVPFVSVPADQLELLRLWYTAIAPPLPGLFPIDLAVLPDGRLGVVLAHGVSVVAGPRELRELLREAGWRGEELLLLAQPPARVWNTTIDHARALVEGLRTDLWLATLGATILVQPDGTIVADGPHPTEAAWCCVAYGRTAANVTLPAALQVPRYAAHAGLVPRPSVPASSRPALPAGSLASLAAGSLAVGAPSVALPAAGAPGTPSTIFDGDLTQHLAALPAAPVSPGLPALAGPAPENTDARAEQAVPAPAAGLGRELGTAARHGVPWLPASPAVNPRAMDLYLWTPLPGDRSESWTLPSADLFLLAAVDPLRLAQHRPTGYLLRLRVPERAAVELTEHLANAPAGVQERTHGSGSTHLLPLAWLRDLRVTARFDLDGTGGVRARTDISAGELAIRFEGAEHGVPGLPNEVVHWPDRGSRADAPCYLVLPEASRMSLEIVHGGFVPLSRQKLAIEEGSRLLEVRIRRRRAIDVPATLDSLGGMAVVGRVHDFVGVDLLLPEADLDKAVVTKIWRRGTGNRVHVDKLGGETLYEALLDESILSGRRSSGAPALMSS
jgi:hypothetical protein